MPAASKQQQKFFGVVKAMQSGDLPKKGAAGKVAKDMNKKDVDKYASTKHKGLPKKVKQETMKISELNKIVEEEVANVIEGVFSRIDLIRQDSKNTNDFIRNVFKDSEFKDMKKDKEFIKYLKSIYEGFGSDAQRKAAFASGYKAKGKKKKTNEDVKVDVVKDNWPEATVKINGKNHDITFDDYDLIDDHDNEGKDLYYMGEDEEGNKFEVDVYADMNGNVQEVHWDTLAMSEIGPRQKLYFNEAKILSKKEVRDLKVKIHNAKTIGKYFTEEEAEFLSSLFESVNEAKMTPAKVQKAQKELVATVQLLKKNFPMYKAAKDSGDEKKLAKHRDIALKLTKKKKQLELALDQALTGLYADAKLDLKEEVKLPPLPKFKRPFDAYKYIMDLRNAAMDIEGEMYRKSQELKRLHYEMEQEAEPAGGLMADTYAEYIADASNEHREMRAEFEEIMAKIDQYDQNYLGDEYEDFD